MVAAISKKLPGSFSVELYEALALREGLCLAKQWGLSILWAEVDAVNVAAAINSSLPCWSIVGFVFDDVKALCKDVGVSNCHVISRSGNKMAHHLAYLTISSRRDSYGKIVVQVCCFLRIEPSCCSFSKKKKKKQAD
ncbi:hypothetical protein ACOSQ2_033168 [Xanthoceras sorbifolium]